MSQDGRDGWQVLEDEGGIGHAHTQHALPVLRQHPHHGLQQLRQVCAEVAAFEKDSPSTPGHHATAQQSHRDSEDTSVACARPTSVAHARPRLGLVALSRGTRALWYHPEWGTQGSDWCG